MVRSALVTTPRRTPEPRSAPAPRAPRRSGTRTTLRVPDDLAESVEHYAAEHETSTNDALVRLAYDGVTMYEHDREVSELARVRRDAIMLPAPVRRGVCIPTAAEITDAMLRWTAGAVDCWESCWWQRSWR